MSRLPAETQAYRSPSPGEPWRGQPAVAGRTTSRGIAPGWLVTGLVVVGLGALAWYYLGPDLRRYLKIERM